MGRSRVTAAASPPIMRQYPSLSPQMPPLVPASTNCDAARRRAQSRAAHPVLVVAIAAIDDGVAAGEAVDRATESCFPSGPRQGPSPHCPRRSQSSDQVFERRGARSRPPVAAVATALVSRS